MKPTQHLPDPTKVVRTAAHRRPSASDGAATNAQQAAPSAPEPSLVYRDGRIVSSPAKARRARPPRRVSAPAAVPERVLRALLRCGAMRAEIEFRERIANVRCARLLMARGVSLNQSARALGLSPSRLCVFLQQFRDRGREGLRPGKPGGRPGKDGIIRQSNLHVLFDFGK